MSQTRGALSFPSTDRPFLEPYLPTNSPKPNLPFTTLTFATSLDSSLSISPGVQTVLSGPQSKAMTHYLRSRHDAILIGVGTAIADNPSLNCRIEGCGGYGGKGLLGQPRPIIVDPSARWEFDEEAKILGLVREGRGRGPFIITGVEPPAKQRGILEGHGGKYITLPTINGRLEWSAMLESLSREGLKSVMIEGGGAVINTLLEPESQNLIDSVILTIAPTWLGQGGVVISPKRRVEGGRAIPASRLKDVKWYPFGEDVVMCGTIN